MNEINKATKSNFKLNLQVPEYKINEDSKEESISRTHDEIIDTGK